MLLPLLFCDCLFSTYDRECPLCKLVQLDAIDTVDLNCHFSRDMRYFQQCVMYDQQRLRAASAYAQTDKSLC